MECHRKPKFIIVYGKLFQHRGDVKKNYRTKKVLKEYFSANKISKSLSIPLVNLHYFVFSLENIYVLR